MCGFFLMSELILFIIGKMLPLSTSNLFLSDCLWFSYTIGIELSIYCQYLNEVVNNNFH